MVSVIQENRGIIVFKQPGGGFTVEGEAALSLRTLGTFHPATQWSHPMKPDSSVMFFLVILEFCSLQIYRVFLWKYY